MTADGDVLLCGAARTPFGRFGGALRELGAVQLGAFAMRAALVRAGLAPDAVGTVYAGVGLIGGGVLSPARQAVLKAGLPQETPSMTVDRACCSGLSAIALGWKDIRLGIAETALCGGFESLSNVPFLWPRQRGARPGPVEVRDPLVIGGDAVDRPIAVYTGEEALRQGIDRVQQDEWAVESHRRWFAAEDAGFFAAERVAVEGADGAVMLATDESPRRDTSVEKLARLKPVYGGPSVTAGNAPGLNDGAAFVVLASGAAARRLGLAPLARIVDHVELADAPTSGSYAPALAIDRLLRRRDLGVDALDQIEINEAYAATPLVSTLRLAGGDLQMAERLRRRTNPNGGAVALGHPLGASGARLAMTLVAGLRRRGGGRGVAAICGGFGQGDAMLLETVG